MKRFRTRLIAPLGACAISGGAAVVGGACWPFPTVKDPPTLQTGTYVLALTVGKPAVFVDSSGRSLRIVADTITLAANQFYDEHAAVAITPPGGTEGAVGPFIVTHQPYVVPSAGVVIFIATRFGGSTHATALSTTSFRLDLPVLQEWHYDKR